jgi:hypothetical protein
MKHDDRDAMSVHRALPAWGRIRPSVRVERGLMPVPMRGSVPSS